MPTLQIRQNTPITATQIAPDSTSSADSATSSSTQGGRMQPSLDSPGPTLYYGSVALAVFACVLIAAATRFYLLKKKDRRRREQRQVTERADLERRGEASGLPTYSASRGQAAGLPSYNMTWESPPVSSPAHGSTPTEQHSHFHFHLPRNFPSLPVALHLRPGRAEDVPMSNTNTTTLPSYDGPPKYNDAAPIPTEREGDGTRTPVDRPDRSLAVEEASFEQEFIHPEEARRREAERQAAIARGDPPM